MKSVKVAVCGMKCTELCTDNIKITGIHFSYNKEKRNEKNVLQRITKIQNVLKKALRMSRLTLEGNFKGWETLENEYHLDNKLYFQWIQLIHAVPLIWKQKINNSGKNVEKIMPYKIIT